LPPLSVSIRPARGPRCSASAAEVQQQAVSVPARRCQADQRYPLEAGRSRHD
jgi:hypothetical protein